MKTIIIFTIVLKQKNRIIINATFYDYERMNTWPGV